MPSKIMKDGRIRWKGRVQKNGLIRQKLFSTRGEALGWEAEQRKTDWEKTDTVCSLKQWAEMYLDYSLKFSRKTYMEKKLAFRMLFAAKKGKAPIVDPLAPVDTLTPGKVLAALKAQFETRGGNAANGDRKNLVAGWHWGMKYLDLPSPNPCLVEKFPEVHQPRYVPSEADFWKVFSLTEGQDRVMLQAYLHLGARRSELFRLLWEDVDFDNSRIRLSTRKRHGGTLEYDWLPMTGDLHESLRWWEKNRTFPESPYVFVSEAEGGFCDEQYGKPFRQRLHFMKTLCGRAGVKPFGFHAIRHLTASILYRIGQPVSVIQALRHKSPNTTAIYLRSLGLEETRGALDALADRFQTVSGGQVASGGSAKVTRFPQKNVVIRRKTGERTCAEKTATPTHDGRWSNAYVSVAGSGKTVFETVSTTKKGHAV